MTGERLWEQFRQVGELTGAFTLGKTSIGLYCIGEQTKRFAERMHLRSSLMYLSATHPEWHKPVKIDPQLLNEDGTINTERRDAGIAKMWRNLKTNP
ncbi:hypothetical protein A3F00_03490 [Candidatus Daviesbacteria bacterium RIFCSPHIGHO2_12_FULL_37_11]|uniref:Uncharacterized protein n=1 Tax=Candidatus Daviesbacteria bacterium RIFCSPHIGHO2_12_FULL_37_11 TaxID=1797777 RepID=A0A1F5KD57_9BACT|nr:MAG: hypothetical protein A2111_00745 [Candidatus Daviesbacteria bacterium GWA1_38_6]OGE18023.1 MAG: hypothetical protein A2769_01150 [Candidatus Daviesbacteria bacterium RIFCSPHIGHO2_01_FULL_37_27]OGE38705.1 MAG: hypothetical protein A3F00_03490 [Candidatus Daviesbacteria bacterium RIFCSPHIGHO2_12_FULL_37_11]OGE45795.1 MAG: hypothetical protein A3B39_01030 [Candidatus Daviesbacteria bacterium RIFCSPLOWO2_01_FULL_37_10]